MERTVLDVWTCLPASVASHLSAALKIHGSNHLSRNVENDSCNASPFIAFIITIISIIS